MAIHRVSVSLSDSEYSKLLQASALLGIKPTTAAHRSIKHGLIALSKEAQAFESQLQTFRFFQQVFSSGPPLIPPEVVKPQPKPKVQPRSEVKKSKKRNKRR